LARTTTGTLSRKIKQRESFYKTKSINNKPFTKIAEARSGLVTELTVLNALLE
jgi:hypothetical protein